MKYCSNCGKEMEDTAKFCSGCGTPFDNTKKDTFKCPQCGQILESFTAFCPACGYELRNTKSSDSIKSFFEKIERIEEGRDNQSTNKNEIDETDKKIISLIQSYAIPNNKEDVLEFFILASTNVFALNSGGAFDESNRKTALCEAWFSKCEQAYTKATLLFDKNDSDYINISEKYQKIKKSMFMKKHSLGFFVIACGALALFILYLGKVIIDLIENPLIGFIETILILMIGAGCIFVYMKLNK